MANRIKREMSNGGAGGTPQPNAWLIHAAGQVEPFAVTIAVAPALIRDVAEGDGVALLRQYEGKMLVTLFAGIYRLRRGLDATTLYFDAMVRVEPPREATMLGIHSIECDHHPCGLGHLHRCVAGGDGQRIRRSAPAGGEDRRGTPPTCRRLLKLAVADDLLGPANGPQEEVVGMSVRDRYLVGKLAPKVLGNAAAQPPYPTDALEVSESGGKAGQPLPKMEPYHGRNEPGVEFSSAEAALDADDGESRLAEGSTNQSLVPSSLGFTFCVDGDVDAVELEVHWGRYERAESETEVNKDTGKPLRVWKRIPSGGKQKLLLKEGTLESFAIDPACPEVLMRGTVRPKLPKGDRLVTLFSSITSRSPRRIKTPRGSFSRR